MKFEIKQLHDQIWLITFKNPVDLAMHFLPFQEFYESPNPRFRNNPNFDTLAFIEWYAKEHDNLFTYTTDWNGFNIPDYVFDRLNTSNKYITKMKRIVNNIINPNKDERKFYVLGCLIGDDDTLDHELAHAFYYINEPYKTACLEILNTYHEVRKSFGEWLKIVGYTDEVLDDETQAYLSTGMTDAAEKCLEAKQAPHVQEVVDKFEENFQYWKDKILTE